MKLKVIQFLEGCRHNYGYGWLNAEEVPVGATLFRITFPNVRTLV